jgi:hypothetical protein
MSLGDFMLRVFIAVFSAGWLFPLWLSLRAMIAFVKRGTFACNTRRTATEQFWVPSGHRGRIHDRLHMAGAGHPVLVVAIDRS